MSQRPENLFRSQCNVLLRNGDNQLVHILGTCRDCHHVMFVRHGTEVHLNFFCFPSSRIQRSIPVTVDQVRLRYVSGACDGVLIVGAMGFSMHIRLVLSVLQEGAQALTFYTKSLFTVSFVLLALHEACPSIRLLWVLIPGERWSRARQHKCRMDDIECVSDMNDMVTIRTTTYSCRYPSPPFRRGHAKRTKARRREVRLQKFESVSRVSVFCTTGRGVSETQMNFEGM